MDIFADNVLEGGGVKCRFFIFFGCFDLEIP